jgi:hypothetical protein
MRSICINDIRPESLVALSHLPEEHDHFGSQPVVSLLVSGNIGGAGMEGVVENSRDTFRDELEVLRSM